MHVKLRARPFLRRPRTAPRRLKTIIVDETLARRFWPNSDPIGRRMYSPNDINDLMNTNDKTKSFTVVGVIADIKLHDLTEGKQSVGAYFFPTDQDPISGLTFAVKTAGDPLALTSGVRGVALRPRSRTAGVRHPDDGRTDWRSRWSAGTRRCCCRSALASIALFLVGDRHLRCACVSRDAADQGNRHPHRARQAAPGRSSSWCCAKGCC